MAQKKNERQRMLETLRELIESRRVAMLTTMGADGVLRSRPMIPARHEFDGDLWFFALDNASAVADIHQHTSVNVAYAEPKQHQFISTSGTAEIVRDRQKMELLWKDELREWFPEGLATSNLVLIRIGVEEAEFWDEQPSSVEGLLSAMISWKTSFEKVHERIRWQEQSGEPPREEAARRIELP